ncbi:MAG: ATP-binding cassette domain-containing protein [Gammaproteobacteria bacterium]|nr:ATP-binding cassette domain-containing protein [Gammaproteobacteria bacterium]
MHNLIEVQGLDVGYELPILRQLSFSIARSEMLVVLGTNGVGKSTLMKTLLGLLPKKNGLMKISCQKIALMPQLQMIQHQLPMTVHDFLNLFIWLSPQWYENVINKLELIEFMNIPIKSLSCGMWQRVNLAQALAEQPELVFLDEPTQGLDVQWQIKFYEFISAYAAEYQAGVCCIAHDTLAISRYAHKVLCLDHQPAHDEIIQQRTAEEAFVIYQHNHHQCGGCL